MRKKIIGVAAVIVFLAMLCAQSVAAITDVYMYVWTDKSQYKPGEKGILKISVLNERAEPISIRNISITYPWFAYDAEKGEWVGNVTLKLDPVETVPERGGKYYKEVEFTIPTDGRVAQYPGVAGPVTIEIGTNKGTGYPEEPVSLVISSISWPMSIAGLDTWMTSLTAVIVVCTIILAIVIFLATRRPRAPRMVAPPPPPKAKAA